MSEGNGNGLPAGLVIPAARAERRRQEKAAKNQPPVVIVGGTILVRVLPNESQMNVWGVDPHAVPMILRGLADSYEREHAADPAFAEAHGEHPHGEAETEPAAAGAEQPAGS